MIPLGRNGRRLGIDATTKPTNATSRMLSTTTLTRSTTRDESLSEETIFDVLSNRRRRFAIHALKRADGPMEVKPLSKRIAAWEHGIEPDAVEYDQRRNVHSTLKRTHLPMLEESGVIEYDAEANLVEPTAALSDLDIYVEVLRGKEIPWSQYYLGLSALAGAALLAVEVGVPGFAALDPLSVAVFTVTAFLVSAIAHYRYGEHARLGNGKKPPELRKRE